MWEMIVNDKKFNGIMFFSKESLETQSKPRQKHKRNEFLSLFHFVVSMCRLWKKKNFDVTASCFSFREKQKENSLNEDIVRRCAFVALV